MRCVNEKCLVDPSSSIDAIVVTIDGDMACCPYCQIEYEKQKRKFFDNIGNDAFYNSWLRGGGIY